MSEESYQKYRDPHVFEAVRLYGVKAISKILKHLEMSVIFLPGERITEKDLRNHREELETVFDVVVSSGPDVIPKCDTNVPEGSRDDTRSDTILQMVRDLQERVDHLEILLKSPVEKIYKGVSHALTIRLPEELRRDLDILKTATGESINSLVLKAVSRMVSTMGK